MDKMMGKRHPEGNMENLRKAKQAKLDFAAGRIPNKPSENSENPYSSIAQKMEQRASDNKLRSFTMDEYKFFMNAQSAANNLKGFWSDKPLGPLHQQFTTSDSDYHKAGALACQTLQESINSPTNSNNAFKVLSATATIATLARTAHVDTEHHRTAFINEISKAIEPLTLQDLDHFLLPTFLKQWQYDTAQTSSPERRSSPHDSQSQASTSQTDIPPSSQSADNTQETVRWIPIQDPIMKSEQQPLWNLRATDNINALSDEERNAPGIHCIYGNTEIYLSKEAFMDLQDRALYNGFRNQILQELNKRCSNKPLTKNMLNPFLRTSDNSHPRFVAGVWRIKKVGMTTDDFS